MKKSIANVGAENLQPIQPQQATNPENPKIGVIGVLTIAITFTLSCTSDIEMPPAPSYNPKMDCIREGLGISANTLDRIAEECGASRSEVLSQLPSSVGSCKAKDLDFDKPIKDIKSECDVDEMPIVSSSSNGNTGGGSSSSAAGSSSSVCTGSGRYCNYSGCSLWSADGKSCSLSTNGYPNQGGCYPMPTDDNCASGIVVSVCPANAIPPAMNYCEVPYSSSAMASSSSRVSSIVYSEPVTYEGETYQTVVIGTQTWMARNLNYAVGSSKCYNDNETNCATYGRLYDWATAMGLPSKCNNTLSTSDAECTIFAKHKGICPSGWHLPSDAEWGALMTAVGGSGTAGTKLKATSGWNENGNGTDNYGFAALPGGYGSSGGSFDNAGNRGNWQSASEVNSYDAYYRHTEKSDRDFYQTGGSKNFLFSVRCLKDY